jgi:hypothetical protein
MIQDKFNSTQEKPSSIVLLKKFFQGAEDDSIRHACVSRMNTARAAAT